MIRICRPSIAVLLAVSIGGSTTLFAAEAGTAPAAAAPQLRYQGQPLVGTPPLEALPVLRPDSAAASSAFGQRGYRGRGRRNDAAMTAMLLGAAAAIAGTAVLVYANRPDCSVDAHFNGCGYGSKVVGGSLLSAGLVGLLVGAVTWR